MADSASDNDDVERALTEGTLSNLQAPLRPGDCGIVARWIGETGAAVLEVSYDAEAEPGGEYDGLLWTFRRSSDDGWENDGGPGTDFPMVPGDRPVFSRDVFPIEGLDLTTGAGHAVVTYGVAAEEVVSVEIQDNGGARRVEVGVFGAVVLGTDHPPAEVVLLDEEGIEIAGNWHPQIHTYFTARTQRPETPSPDGRY